MIRSQTGGVELDAVVAKTLDGTTNIEGTWCLFFLVKWVRAHTAEEEMAHMTEKRKDILALGTTRHISWRSVELKVMAPKGDGVVKDLM